MNPLVPWIWLAGGIQLLIASANFVVPRKLEYSANLAKISPIVRQIFIVHAGYIVLVLVFFSALCFLFALDLSGKSALGKFLSGFLAVFWGLRVAIQLFYYDRDLKRQNWIAHFAFIALFVYLSIVFAIAAAGAAR